MAPRWGEPHSLRSPQAQRSDPIDLDGATYGAHRAWRGTTVAAGEAYAAAPGVLGHEWDEPVDNGHSPPFLQRLSSTTVDNVQCLMDHGAIFDTGTATHSLVLFKHPTSGGWADAMINFRFVDDNSRWNPLGKDAGSGHICELQLIHNEMLFVRKDWGAHESYSKFRTAVQLLEAADRMDVVDKVDKETQGELDKNKHIITAVEADIDEALDIAQAGFVRDLPWGLDTRIGEQGMALSGGQRQRLALARAVLARPKVLVLDDTLSALDVHTEKLVEDALQSVLGSTTGLVVAHRASTVLLADRVALLQDGTITHVGDHRVLLADVPAYRELLAADAELSELSDLSGLDEAVTA